MSGGAGKDTMNGEQVREITIRIPDEFAALPAAKAIKAPAAGNMRSESSLSATRLCHRQILWRVARPARLSASTDLDTVSPG